MTYAKNGPAPQNEDSSMANDSPEITRVSILLLYLHQKIENELDEKKLQINGDRDQGKNGIKLLDVSYGIKNIFEEEVNKQNGKQRNGNGAKAGNGKGAVE